MSKESRAAAKRKKYAVQRTLLILLMGSKCKFCPCRAPWRLEFHHTEVHDWDPQKVPTHRRIRLYMRDWANGILVLACSTCNKKRGKPTDKIPF